MKFRCPREVWVRGISAVQNAVGSPISNPIVENILVSCEGQKVSFSQRILLSQSDVNVRSMSKKKVVLFFQRR